MARVEGEAQRARPEHEEARAIVLEPGGIGASRLGGLPVLPRDVAWPTCQKRPLTHLATIALAELPDVPGRDLLPADGHLAFFADLTDEAEFYEPIEPDGLGRDRVAVIHAAAGEPTHQPAPPHAPPRDEYDVPVVMRERRVRPTARLQIRHMGFGYATRLYGLDAIADDLLERLAWSLNGSVDHQLLGYPAVVQDDPREGARVALFHIGHDTELGFEFLDGGDLLFFGSPDAIAARAWEQLTVWPSSC